MSEQRYDIYFRGEVQNGFERDSVKNNVGQLFKASPAKVEQLFSGKVIALKKDLDKTTAAKFKQALEKAGAKIYIKAAVQIATSADSLPESPIEPAAAVIPTPITETNKTAATVATEPATSTPPSNIGVHLDILPAGSDVLTEAERIPFEEVDIDISNIKLASVFDVLETPHKPTPPAPDVSHITTAEVGADVLEGYHDNEPTPTAPDVSHITTAEVGADVLEGYHQSKPSPLAPDVSHIQLTD